MKNGRVLVEKVEGIHNTADIGTKPLDEKTLVRHRGTLGLTTLPEELRTAAIATVQSGWFRRGAKGQILPMMLAAAAPLAAGADDERGLCLGTTALQQQAAGGGGGWQTTLMVILMCILVGVVLGWKLRGWFGDSKKDEKKSRSVKTQSQTRYAWDRAEPRFIPLTELMQGSWAE